MTNLIVIVLALTLVLFITSMLTNRSYYNREASPLINPPGRLRGRPGRFNSANVNRSSTANLNDNNDESTDENEIDEAIELTGASSAGTIFREGVLGNYELFRDTTLSRPGDNGSKFDIRTVEGIDMEQVESLKQEYGVNMIASDHIPMDRVVPDIRHPECKYWHYPNRLPTASVVIVFHNEGLTTLMRTAHSVLLRSPRKLIREVLLVDDCSDKKNLGQELEDYIREHFGDFKSGGNLSTTHQDDKGNLGESLYEKSGKVRLLRNKEREGLIRSRTRGAQSATGDVVVFLDAHCEVNQNWLPPLLAPIAKNRRTLTVPIIDGIDSDHFEYVFGLC